MFPSLLRFSRNMHVSWAYHGCESFITKPSLPLAHTSISGLRKHLTFDQDEAYNLVNLARADPAQLAIAVPNLPGYTSRYLTIKGTGVPAICLIHGICIDDFTSHPQPFGNITNHLFTKSISLIPQTLEIERKVATLCMVAGIDQYRAPLIDNVLTFSTRPGPLSAPSELRLFQK